MTTNAEKIARKHSAQWDTVLECIVAKVKAATSREEAFAIATKPFSESIIQKMTEDTFSAEAVFNSEPQDNIEPKCDAMNGIALAVSRGNIAACVELLKYFTKEDINSKDITVWGYREAFSPLHIALNPTINRTASLLEIDDAYVSRLATIIRLLIDKGIEPDIRFKGHYNNQPMAGGTGRGHDYLDARLLNQLRAELLLGGADPTLKGTYFFFREDDREASTKIAFNRFIAMPRNEKTKIKGRLHSEVITDFKALMQDETLQDSMRQNQEAMTAFQEVGTPSVAKGFTFDALHRRRARMPAFQSFMKASLAEKQKIVAMLKEPVRNDFLELVQLRVQQLDEARELLGLPQVINANDVSRGGPAPR
ncbi:MAG: hypothetical protein CMF50_04985 [Legionellales bacterium]|nr:hypothetical protein [Legionellales bacterium]|tara:strand:+ start:43285 stop:44382 length:1098 start_codon:yes stop_codon:yes gene_type:complete